MPCELLPNAEPIRGYRLIEPIGAGGFGEVWKCEAPGGIYKAIKFVFGNLHSVDGGGVRAEDELKAVQRIKSIRHPFLLSIDRVEQTEGQLIIVTELADHNLHEHLTKYQGLGQEGIPRTELLFYLREVAEVLDLLNQQFDLQHLDIKPHNLFLVSNHVKVADFGLVQSLSANKSRIHLGAITPLYAAPELFQGQLSRHCDQYSLAIVYQELLTGKLPFKGKNSRQLLVEHTRNDPDLAGLPAIDRPIVSRALAKNPEQRFSSCMEFVRSLLAEGAAVPASNSMMDFQIPPMRTNGETLANINVETERYRPEPRRTSLPADVLPGHRLLECQSASPLVEVWNAKSLTGKLKQVKFVYGIPVGSPEQVKDLVRRLQSLHHPGLYPTDVVHSEPGRVILSAMPVKQTLRDRFQDSVARRQPGIMRAELVDYLRAAAEVLDYLFQQHSVTHLALNPRQMVLDDGWLRIVDFGLAQLLWHPSQDIAQTNARYSAPELFDRQINRASDQYSLALIFAEMLTGVHPFQGQSPRNRKQPNLESLTPLDRDIIRRALDPDPTQRWPSASEMVLALEGTHPDVQPARHPASDAFIQLLKSPIVEHAPLPPDVIQDGLQEVINDLVTHAGGQPLLASPEEGPLYTERRHLEHRFQAGLPLGSALQRLEVFAQILGARLVEQNDHGCSLRLPLPSTVWQSWRGQKPTMEVRVGLARVNTLSATPIEIKVHIRPLYCNPKQGQEILEDRGPAILEQIRKHLLVNSEKRAQDRLLWPYPLQILPLYHDGLSDLPIECRGKDISCSGIGFYVPHELDTPDVVIRIPNPVHAPVVNVPATLVRALRCADGWYEVGGIFRMPPIRKSSLEFCLPAEVS